MGEIADHYVNKMQAGIDYSSYANRKEQKMQKTGTITSIMATENGGYRSSGGWINTFVMTIQCQDGQFVGEIGSKTTPYPIPNGQQITVEITETDYGPRFKKINPQYSGGGQGGGQQGNRPQGGRGAPKKDDVVQLYIIRQSSIKAAVDFLGEGEFEAKDVIDIAEDFVQYVRNGKKTAGVTQGQQQQYNQAGDGQYHGDNPPPVDDDDIPF